MKKKVKEILTGIIPAMILAFVTSFMFFIYEPVSTYSSNTEDYWFSFGSMIKLNLMYASILFLGIILISLLINIISNLTKKKWIYTFYLLLFNVVFVSLYIQGNFLAGSLPVLDGSSIKWDGYITQKIISVVLWLIVLAVNIYIYIKWNKEYKKIISYVSAGIFTMIFVSFITLISNSQIYKPKGTYMTTYDNFNKLSSSKNFLILVLDMEDSRYFAKVLKDIDKEYVLKDFTYFPDTLSTYGFTRESLPYILSGKWYQAEQYINDYYNDAMNNSILFNELNKRDYDINIYEEEFYWTDEKALSVDNVKVVNSKINKISFLKQEMKYILFKYLPYNLKKYSKIEWMDYSLCRETTNDVNNLYTFNNKLGYEQLNEITLQNRNYFQFVHQEGGHFPFDLNQKMESITNGTYDDKIASSITYLEKYLDRIKESGEYDNTAIIVMADHGYNDYAYDGRQNPIFYVKGMNETHDKMLVSDKKVSYTDLNDSIYKDLLDGKKSSEILPDIEENRVRRFLYLKSYDDMYEQLLDGHAWETNKLKNTGERYNR